MSSRTRRTRGHLTLLFVDLNRFTKSPANAAAWRRFDYDESVDSATIEELARAHDRVERLRRRLVRHLIARALPEKWRDVLELRLLGRTLSEVGAMLGICKQRVARIEASAIVRLREHILTLQERHGVTL